MRFCFSALVPSVRLYSSSHSSSSQFNVAKILSLNLERKPVLRVWKKSGEWTVTDGSESHFEQIKGRHLMQEDVEITFAQCADVAAQQWRNKALIPPPS